MELTLNILLDELSDCNPLCYIKDKSRAFTGVRLISPNPEKNPSNKLIVCKLSQALKAKGLGHEYSVAAVIDSPLPRDSAILQNMVLFDTDLRPELFFIRVQSIFEKYSDWCFEMDQCLIKHRSIQDILTLSETVIGNYITISDSAFSLVAYTQNLKCDDDITRRLVEKGYHDQEAINIFNKAKLMNFWKDAVDIYVRDTGLITSVPIMSKVIHYNNSYYAHVVMLCTNRLPSEGLKDLFRILIDHLMTCFERQWIENNQMPHVYDSLLLDLLESSDLSPETVSARARNSGLSVKGNYVLARVSSNDSAGIMLQRLCNELSTRITQSRVTLSSEILIALIPYSTHKPFSQLEDVLQEIMERYNAECGLSDPFSSLFELKTAGAQALIALKAPQTGTAIASASSRRKDITRVNTFSRCYPGYALLQTDANSSVIKCSASYRALDKLCENDQKRGTNNFELLYSYLINERKASETAEIMHMHRNNVIYRISKICELTGLDLSDPDVRLRLLLCYDIYKRKE